jgi:3-hexulose-6-phosphate synthase
MEWLNYSIVGGLIRKVMNQRKTLFQIALDILTKQEAKELLTPKMLNTVDIVEIGTPLIIRYGLSIVEQIKDWIKGDKILFADTKIADAGHWETCEAISSGANMVSVLAGASFNTLEEVRDATQLNQAKMVVDIIDLSLSDESKIKFINTLNPDYLCIHLATDVVKKGGSLLEFSRQLSFVSSRRLPLMVAGGIHSQNLLDILKNIQPAVVVAGSSITKASDPELEAQNMRRIIDETILY